MISSNTALAGMLAGAAVSNVPPPRTLDAGWRPQQAGPWSQEVPEMNTDAGLGRDTTRRRAARLGRPAEPVV